MRLHLKSLAFACAFAIASFGQAIAQNQAEAPRYSHKAGFYDSDFQLTITSYSESARIYYTLDGSTPTESSLAYTGPITIDSRAGEPNGISMIRTNPPETDERSFGWVEPVSEVFKGTVVRAIVYEDGLQPSKPVTQTYFVDEAVGQRYTFPVISISTDKKNLFSDSTGIYVPGDIYTQNGYGNNQWGSPNANYHQRGREWEREASIEFFDDSGNQVLAQNAGIRIHGGGTRAMFFKSLRLYARGEYGASRFNYKFFEDVPHASFNRLLLRNSGQDGFNNTLLFRDAFMQNLISHMRFDTQAYQPYIVFINGEYWGIHNMRERYDKHYLERNYGVDPDQIDLLTSNQVVKEGSAAHYDAMINFIENNSLSESENYEHVKTLMDVENFMDYSLSQIFIRNTDWPGNNIDYWRSHTIDPEGRLGHDGRWRWLLFDTDFGFGYGRTDQYTHNTLEMATEAGGDSWPNQDWATFLLRNLLQNEEFKHAFINRFADQLNSAFKPKRVFNLIDEMQARIRPEIEEHIDRWSRPLSLNSWNSSVEGLRIFAENRPGYQRDHIIEHFGLSGVANISVNVSNPNQGWVKVNELDIIAGNPGVDKNPYPWQGEYFQDVPVKIIARPEPGYRLARWEGHNGPQADTLLITLSDDVNLTAVFEIDENYITGNMLPLPHNLSEGDYMFTHWSNREPAGTYPSNMAFLYMNEEDPGLYATAEGFTEGGYDLDSRTRIVGLEEQGFAFINTSNEEGNPGYPGTRLGAAVLAIETLGQDDVFVTWTAGTVLPNSRSYNMRLQYRLGDQEDFRDLVDRYGKPVEYQRGDLPGHSEIIGPVRLPDRASDKPYVQLLWRYYHTGERIDSDTGTRAKLNISDIRVESGSNSLVPLLNLPNNKDKLHADGITLSWSGLPGARHYTIQLSEDASFNDHLFETKELTDTVLAVVSLKSNTEYFWRVKAENRFWEGEWSETRQFTTTASGGRTDDIPREVTLLQNYPNPFNPLTTLTFGLPKQAHVSLAVYNVSGQRVSLLIDEIRAEGYHEVPFDASSLSSGVYFYRLQVDGRQRTMKMTLIK